MMEDKPRTALFNIFIDWLTIFVMYTIKYESSPLVYARIRFIGK